MYTSILLGCICESHKQYISSLHNVLNSLFVRLVGWLECWYYYIIIIINNQQIRNKSSYERGKVVVHSKVVVGGCKSDHQGQFVITTTLPRGRYDSDSEKVWMARADSWSVSFHCNIQWTKPVKPLELIYSLLQSLHDILSCLFSRADKWRCYSQLLTTQNW